MNIEDEPYYIGRDPGQFDQLPFSAGTMERIAIDQLFPHMSPARTREYMTMISAVTGLFEGLPFKFAGTSEQTVAVTSSFPLMKIFNPLSFGGLGVRAYMGLMKIIDAIPFVGKRVVENTTSSNYECEFMLDRMTLLTVQLPHDPEDTTDGVSISVVTRPGEVMSYMTFNGAGYCVPYNLYESQALTPTQVQDNFLYFLLHVKSPYAQHAHQRYAQMHGQAAGPEHKPEM